MQLYPRRFNSLLGAAQAVRRSGDATTAEKFYEELIARHSTRDVEMTEMRQWLDEHAE